MITIIFYVDGVELLLHVCLQCTGFCIACTACNGGMFYPETWSSLHFVSFLRLA
jgi:hypothetical protein